MSIEDVWVEFSMSKFASRADRDNALAREILKLRKFRSDVAQLSLYLCGGHYEPRNEQEGALAGIIIEALKQSGSDILQRSSWMEDSSPVTLFVNESGRLAFREDLPSSDADRSWCTHTRTLRES